MHRLFNALLVMIVLGSGFVLYSLEHRTRSIERDIARTKARIADEREQIKLLEAEWSSLTRPSRIQQLAAEKLGLATAGSGQFVTVEDLAARVPAEPPPHLEEKGKDPIGDILKDMQQP